MIASYLRTSVWRKHKVSIEAQRKIVESKTSSKEITYFVDRGYSGSSINRPAFIELQDWITSSELRRILYVSRYDRISRNLKDALNFLELCQKHYVEVVSILEPIPATLGDKKAAQLLFVQILFSLAEFTRSVTIENINNGLAQKKVKNKLLSAKAPFGYSYQNGRLIPKEQESKMVQLIFNRYILTDTGYKQLAKKLNKEGHSFQNKPFKSYHVAQILKNPIYTGQVGSKSKNLDSYQSEQVVPIISQEVFQQATTKRLSRTAAQQKTRDYPLRKKLVCPHCQRKLTPRKQVSRDKEYHYYACPNEFCGKLLVSAKEVETNTIELVSDYLNQNNQFRSLVVSMQNQIEEANQSKKKLLENVSKKKQLLFQSFEEGKLDHNELKKQLDIINGQQTSIAQINLTQEELTKRLKLLLKLSQTTLKELIWPYIDEVRLNKEKKIQEVIIYGIRIQPRNS